MNLKRDMLAFDASSLIHAWDNYPIRQFPSLWSWMEGKVQTGEFVVSEVAFREVKDKVPDCAKWLEEKGIQKLPQTNAVLQEALRIKGILGIVDDNYHAKGVGENDLFIIAASLVNGIPLVTDEGFQANLPKVMPRCKIPTVCNLPQVNVSWMKFIDLIKNSNEIFH